jgi:release factor glutamine methyltransferase
VSALAQLVTLTERRLMSAGIGDARLEAELVWMMALDLDRTHLFAELALHPGQPALERAEKLVVRRLRHEPAAYLMGRREFFGLEFRVGPGVLIPRTETELVVELALRILAERRGSMGQAVVADVGTGTGAIAVSLAVNAPQVQIDATDISERALEIAALNVEHHGVGDRVKLLRGDLLTPVDRPVDLVVANLPYVMSSEIPTLEPEVRLFEPREALDGGPDGLGVIARLLETVGPQLRSHANLVLELDPRQMIRAVSLAEAAFPKAIIRASSDLTGRPRVLSISL